MDQAEQQPTQPSAPPMGGPAPARRRNPEEELGIRIERGPSLLHTIRKGLPWYGWAFVGTILLAAMASPAVLTLPLLAFGGSTVLVGKEMGWALRWYRGDAKLSQRKLAKGDSKWAPSVIEGPDVQRGHQYQLRMPTPEAQKFLDWINSAYGATSTRDINQFAYYARYQGPDSYTNKQTGQVDKQAVALRQLLMDLHDMTPEQARVEIAQRMDPIERDALRVIREAAPQLKVHRAPSPPSARQMRREEHARDVGRGRLTPEKDGLAVAQLGGMTPVSQGGIQQGGSGEIQ